MARPSAPLVFPTWRDLWESLDGVRELLAAADAVVQRRAAGNQQSPRWTVSENGSKIAIALRALQAWAGGEPPRDAASRPDIAQRIHKIVNPVLRAAAWPRWLLLERAFMDASATGDLLFAALVLRTMSEDVLRQRALDIDENEVAILAGSGATVDQERLKLFFAAAWTSLDTLPRDMVLEGHGWPSLNPMARASPRLERARAALNSYVHPNYGSHIAALFPESAAAARILLEAVVAVYEAFFALSWAEARPAGPTAPIGVRAFESWLRCVRHLQEHTLPEVRRSAGDAALAEVMKVPASIEWLTATRNDLVAMLDDPAAAPLVADLPRHPIGTARRQMEYRMWDGAGAIDVLHLAAARRAERRLAAEFPGGAPEAEDQVRWLRFSALSLQLAMLIDQVKAAAFKTQLVRQIVQGNSLAALLCVRSLIEHRALVVWLPREIGSSLDALAGEVEAEKPLPQGAKAVDSALAKFLAAQAKGSREEQRSWVLDESGGVRVAWLNLRKIVESAFPDEDRFQTLYALSSAAMHGRSSRGGDLLLDAASLTTQARRIGLLVLERLCERDEEMDHLAAALIQSMRIEHAADFGGTAAAVTDRLAQQAFGRLSDAFLPGVDYTGEGTTDSPFCLGSHLEFYQASYALLRQLGIDVSTSTRMLEHDAAGQLCDRWHGPKRDYWFRVPRVSEEE